MELTQIRYFLEVANSEHMTRSAEKLHIAQPALSQAIRRFEENIGVPLFESKGRNIVLTEYGRYLKEQLEPIVRRLDSIPEEMQEMARIHAETIHLNVLAASTLVTGSIIEYKKTHKDVNFNLIQNTEEQKSDIEITTKLFYQKDKTLGNNQFVCPEEIFLAVPNNERFKGISSIRLQDVAREGFVSLAGSRGFRYICDTFCRHADISPNIIFESDNPAAVQNMIAANLGIGFWPEFTWGKLETKKVKLLKISDILCRRDLIITYTVKDKKISNSNSKEYFDFLKQYCLNNKIVH